MDLYYEDFNPGDYVWEQAHADTFRPDFESEADDD